MKLVNELFESTYARWYSANISNAKKVNGVVEELNWDVIETH